MTQSQIAGRSSLVGSVCLTFFVSAMVVFLPNSVFAQGPEPRPAIVERNFGELPSLLAEIEPNDLLTEQEQEEQQQELEKLKPGERPDWAADFFKKEIPTEKELEEMKVLAWQLDSDEYRVRVLAERKLRQFGTKLEVAFEKLDLPQSVEAQVRLRRLQRRLDARGLVGPTWTLISDPLPGETLGLEREQKIVFEENGTFHDYGGDQGDDNERWSLNNETGEVRISFNDDYAVNRGFFNADGVVVGHTENVKGKRWTFRLELVESD